MVKPFQFTFNWDVGTAQKVVQRLKSALDGRRNSVQADSCPAILAVLSDAAIASELLGATEPLGWRPTIVGSLAAGIKAGEQHLFNIVIVEKELVGSEWRHAVSRFSRLPAQPIVLLLSEHVGPSLADDLAQWGGYAVLGLPLRADRVKASLHAGWQLWKNQEHLRRLTR